jgi:hypothetical protein
MLWPTFGPSGYINIRTAATQAGCGRVAATPQLEVRRSFVQTDCVVAGLAVVAGGIGPGGSGFLVAGDEGGAAARQLRSAGDAGRVSAGGAT